MFPSHDHKGHDVVGVDNMSGGYEENLQGFESKEGKFTLYYIDLADTKVLERIFNDIMPDIVYHFAAYAAVGMSPFIRKFNYQNNTVNTAQIINMCIKYKVGRLVFTSSMDVYGEQDVPFDETQVPQPLDPYGIAKYACELDIQCAGREHGARS